MKKAIIVFTLILAGIMLVPSYIAQAKAMPKEAYISGFVGHPQTLSLSCESRSASDWAAYWGVSIAELDFLDKLPRSDNPNIGFVGNPDHDWGYAPPYSYGVHADPVAQILRNIGLDAHAGSGLSWEEIQNEIAEGRPVIVWVLGKLYSGESKIYTTKDGQDVLVAAFEHTMILIGYDEESVYLVDAFTGRTNTHTLETFFKSWAVLNNMAVIGRGSQSEFVDTDNLQKEDEIRYTVQTGDTLARIASAWDIFWQEIAANNKISYPYLLAVGLELLIQSADSEEEAIPEVAPVIESTGESYIVQSGDHLVNIANDWNVDWHLLAEFNHLDAPYMLYPGDTLQIPSSDFESGGENSASPKDIVPEFVTVAFNESVYSLAHRFDISWLDLLSLNHIGFPFMLHTGQEIQLR